MKCATKTCSAEAIFHVSWPGQPVDMCEVCKDRANAIAGFMGFNLEIMKLAVLLVSVEVDNG